jgi:hypothetical protein
MPRATFEAAEARRTKVEFLQLRGASVQHIARETQSDPRTIKRDLAAIARARAADLDVPAARLRLLESAREIERECWRWIKDAPPNDWNTRLGAVAKILAAQAQQATLLGQVEAASIVEDIQLLKAELEQLKAAQQSGSLRRVR